jgi:hypothetical protein
MNARTRYLTVSAALLATTVPASKMLARRYGTHADRRFGIGMASAVGAQQLVVAVALWPRNSTEVRARAHRLTMVDLVTLSRGTAAAVLIGLVVSGIRDRRGFAGWAGWAGFLLYVALVYRLHQALNRRGNGR